MREYGLLQCMSIPLADTQFVANAVDSCRIQWLKNLDREILVFYPFSIL